jgi:hypothetical protein
MPLRQVDELAPDVRVENHEIASVQLSEYWADGPAVLIFLRHFG